MTFQSSLSKRISNQGLGIPIVFYIGNLAFCIVLVISILHLADGREKEWYETTSVYQIYPRSFKDSDGDGVGDLQGVREKLDYLHDLGIETLWLSPIYLSPMVDSGYDVTDYRKIDPTFGTMEDFKELLKSIHDRGMKLILDFVPNHTSDESEWFKKSEKREEPYTDFYIWKEATHFDNNSRPLPPNNWLSFFGGSCWTWHEGRQQFYFRQFSKHQPDLNFRNPNVRAAIKEVLHFWLDLGVDGFRVDAVAELYEDELLRNNPWRSPEAEKEQNFWGQIRMYSTSQNETYDLLFEWRDVLDEYIEKDNKTRMMTLETYESEKRLVGYISDASHRTTNIPSYFGLVSFGSMRNEGAKNASVLDRLVRSFRESLPPNGVPSYVLGNHDLPRLESMVDSEFSEAMLMLELLLPGVVGIYYGEEIRMRTTRLRPDEVFDQKKRSSWSRDMVRTPMQWDDSQNAGFTIKKKPWLPVNPDYWHNNVKHQLQDPHSHLNFFKRVVKLRQLPVFKNGQLETCVVSPWLYMYVRKLEDQPPFVVILNVGSETETVCLTSCGKDYLPNVLEVHTSTANAGYKTGDKFIISGPHESHCSILRPKAAVLLTTAEPKANHGSISAQLSFPLIASLIFVHFRGCSIS